MTIVDVHAHHVPRAFLDAVARDGGRRGIEVAREDGGWRVAVNGRRARQLLREDLVDLDRRLETMDACGVDVQVLSCWAGLVGYDVAAGADHARRFNEALAEVAAGTPARFRALAIAPLQDPAAAAVELQHAVGALGMAGAEILTRVGERELDDPALDPFWDAAEGLGCLLLLHPHESLAGRRLERYRLDNLVGNPAETTIAVAHLVLGGVLERFPGLRLCAVHAGGYVPYAAGRLDRGWHATPGVVATRTTRAPSEWLRELYYDTVAHSPAVLRWLAEFAGPRRMLLGSDFPFAMGEPDPVGTVRGIDGLDDEDRAAVLGGNALAVLDAARAAR